MEFYFVTGKLGQGKTLICISKIKERIEKGCLVATNCDLFLHHMFNRNTDKPRVMRIPDKPTLFDLESIGRGYPKSKGYQENRNGLLVLDECGDWFNSRNWQDKTRGDVNSWFRHARKLGWDVCLIVQDISLIDSQARDALAASIARAKRMDKLAIPFVTMFTKYFMGYAVRPNKFHIARVEDSDGLFQDRWIYRGSDLYSAYDTSQIFNSNYDCGTYSMLTPWHLYGRYSIQWTGKNIMRITRIYLKKYSRVSVASFASFATFLMCYFLMPVINTHDSDSLQDSKIALAKNHDEQKNIEPELTLSDKFDGWRFDGSQHINNDHTYFFVDYHGNRYTNKMRSMINYEYVEHGFCSIEIYNPISNDTVVLHCNNPRSRPVRLDDSESVAHLDF